MRLFVFGTGYVGARVARHFAAGGTTRATWDGKSPFTLPKGTTHVLSTIAPDRGGQDPVARYVDLSDVGWRGYLSSTSVYTDTRRGQDRRSAESQWARATLFRSTGIYGPGRNLLARLRAGKVVWSDVPGKVWNRIYVDDLVQTIVHAILHSAAGVFDVADGQPRKMADDIALAARLLGVPPPPPIPLARLPSGLRSFYQHSAAINNDRIRTVLGVKLLFPSHAEGLCHLHKTPLGF